MVQKIVWSPESIDTYISILTYPEEKWTEREVDNFVSRVDQKIILLKQHPQLGRISNKRKKTYRTLIDRHTTLVYHYKPIKQEIELVTFWSNSRNPDKYKY